MFFVIGLTFERVVISPIGKYILLDVLVQRLLHAVKVAQVISLPAFHGVEVSSADGFFQHRASLAIAIVSAAASAVPNGLHSSNSIKLVDN